MDGCLIPIPLSWAPFFSWLSDDGCAYVASAARRSYGGRANKTGEGVGYGDGAPRGDGEATAFAAMLVCMTMSA